MNALRTLPLLALLAAATACGGGEPGVPVEAPATPATAPEAAEPGEPATPVTAPVGAFNWDSWAAVVNENPCGWLSADDLAAIGITGSGTLETTSTETRCIWTDAEGARILSAGVQTWDSAANLAAERGEQVKLSGATSRFSRLESSAGSVTAIYRRDLGRLAIFPNADTETAMILINAQKTMRDDDAAKEVKDTRALNFASRVISAYGL